MQHSRSNSQLRWRSQRWLHRRTLLERSRSIPQWLQRPLRCICHCRFLLRRYRVGRFGCRRNREPSQVPSDCYQAGVLAYHPFLHRFPHPCRSPRPIHRTKVAPGGFCQRCCISFRHRHRECWNFRTSVRYERRHHDCSAVGR